MPKKAAGLTVKGIEALKEPGYYADGGGLYLQVTDGGRSWVFRYARARKRRDMGLGPLDLVSLAEARDKALSARRLLLDGYDPIETKLAAAAAAKLEAAKALTFKTAAEKYVAAHAAGWKGAKVKPQWESTLASYAYPILGALPVGAIDTDLVLKVIEPIWTNKPETARKVRQRIEAILDWSKARGYRTGENPARLRGHLDHLLPAKARRVVHHAALPYPEIGDFMSKLRALEGLSARALELTILTAGRTSEVLGATWEEIDFDNELWTVPADRMKSGKEHRVPLSEPTLSILRELRETSSNEFVFPGGRRGKPLSNMALLMQLRRMKRNDLTTHGFRSTFRDWAAECTDYTREVAEMALAHVVSDKVEAAYRRGDLFEKRRLLMQEWAKFCATPKATGKVVAFRS